MKLFYHTFITLFFLMATVGASSGATKDLLTDYEMPGDAVAPALTVLQHNEDGSNHIIEDVPEVYPAAVPYFLEYIQDNIEDIKEMKGESAAAIAITYGYPDNLEINLLSDKVKKITKKIRPDEKLHGLRIRSAMVMFNFLEGEGEEGGSNVTVGFQLFPEDVEYAGMDIKPDYELKKGSWAIVWERSVRVYTRVYRTVRVMSTPRALIVQAITQVVKTVRAQSRISIVGRGGRVLRVLAVSSWVSTSVTTKVTTIVIPKEKQFRCSCTLNPPPASPVQGDDPCTRRFERTNDQTCEQFSYPGCQCSDS
ncbi:MAG: hypothetical protein D3916_17460 [Candidatus Electrothrix sp. MAN1_4]|nr:hypothetical protein [Candidatus Electrothrix sp. MAN1_4]